MTTVFPGTDVWVRATVRDPFGRDDINESSTTLTVTEPGQSPSAATLVLPSQQPTSLAEKTFEYNLGVVNTLGDWSFSFTAAEGTEGLVTNTEVATLTVDDFLTLTYDVANQDANRTSTALADDILLYTATTDTTGDPPSVSINQAIPALTENLNVGSISITGPSGAINPDANGSDNSNLILDFVAPAGTTTLIFEVEVVAGVVPGDLINDTLTLTNVGLSNAAQTVVVQPFSAPGGNKPLYADTLDTTGIFDRTVTTATSSVVINPSASQAFNVTPTLLSSLDLAAGDIHIPIWISRDGATNASKREIEASLSYSGAVSGTIGSDTITNEINSGNDSAQYFWFTVNLDSPLTLPTGTILTLTIANNTSTSGESIRVHALRSGEQSGGNVSSLISLNATDPLNVSDIEFLLTASTRSVQVHLSQLRFRRQKSGYEQRSPIHLVEMIFLTQPSRLPIPHPQPRSRIK